jgi:hypothetical protein
MTKQHGRLSAYIYSLDHGEDEVAMLVFTAEDNYSWLHSYNGAPKCAHWEGSGICCRCLSKILFKEHMTEVLGST